MWKISKKFFLKFKEATKIPFGCIWKVNHVLLGIKPQHAVTLVVRKSNFYLLPRSWVVLVCLRWTNWWLVGDKLQSCSWTCSLCFEDVEKFMPQRILNAFPCSCLALMSLLLVPFLTHVFFCKLRQVIQILFF